MHNPQDDAGQQHKDLRAGHQTDPLDREQVPQRRLVDMVDDDEDDGQAS